MNEYLELCACLYSINIATPITVVVCLFTSLSLTHNCSWYYSMFFLYFLLVLFGVQALSHPVCDPLLSFRGDFPIVLELYVVYLF